MSVVEFDISIEDHTREYKEKLLEEFTNIVEEMQSDAKRFAPVDKELLRRQILLFKIGVMEYMMICNVDYGLHVEFGTKPHLIEPVNAKALMFPRAGGTLGVSSGGKGFTKFEFGGKKVQRNVVFAKRVFHPGTNAQPFFRPAFDIAKYRIESLIQ